MTPSTLDVLYPLASASVREVLPFARLVGPSGAGRLWFGQSLRLDPAHVTAALAGAGTAVPVGTAVALMALRHPFAVASEARSLAAVTGHGVVTGLGVGAPEVAEAFGGARLDDPVGYARAYVEAVAELLDGRVVERHTGPLPMTCRLLPAAPAVPGAAGVPGAGATSDAGPGTVEVGLAALRPRMARLAGEVADTVLTWLVPPGYLHRVLVPEVKAGAALRRRPGHCRVTAVVQLALRRPGRDVLHAVHTAAAGHLATTTYAGMLRRAGLDVSEGDTRAAAAAVLAEGAVSTGTAHEAVAAVRRYLLAGADTVVLDTAGVLRTEGPDAALRDLSEVLRAWTDDLPGSSTYPGR